MRESGKPNDRARLAEAALFQWDKENEADSPHEMWMLAEYSLIKC